VLGAVAVVDVPVDDRHALGPVRLAGVERRQRGVAEDAEAAPEIALGVVPRRAHERIGVVDVTAKRRFDGLDRTTGGERRDLVAAGAERGELAGVAATARAHLLDPLEVLARVQAEDLLLAGRARAQRGHLCKQPGHVEQVAQTPLRGCALAVHLRLNEPAGRQEP
jgi:hypothetical protein